MLLALSRATMKEWCNRGGILSMLLILDVDYTLNRFYPPSIHELAPAELLAQNGPPLWDWIVDHLSTVEYPVHEEAVEVLQHLRRCDPLVVVSTARPETLRDVTERWLQQFFHFDQLFMRPVGDFRVNADVKRDILTNSILPLGEGRQPYAFEDDAGALAMYKEVGVKAFAAPDCWSQLRTQLSETLDPGSVQSILEGSPLL
jgi:hypothetical protein